MTWTLVSLAALALLALPGPAEAASARFVPYTGEFAYGLEIAPPWTEGGTLVINFPEHLERFPDTQGILRHNDTKPNGHWVISKDGKQAVLDVDSPTMAGVHVLGKAKVTGPGRVELSMRITNHSDRDMEGIIPLYCLHYRGLTGFPQWVGNFEHSFVVLNGKVTAIADLPTENPKADVKAAYVRGCPQRDTEKFPRSRGGLAEQELDRALTAVTSLDGKRAVLYAWTPGKTMLSNAAIPCIHADPLYDPIPIGHSGERTGVLIFTEEPVAKAMTRLMKEGVGLPKATR